MTTKISDPLRNLMVETLASYLSGATLSIYTGSQPASTSASPTGTKLLEFSGLSYLTPASGGQVDLDVSGSPQDNALASGTAGWGRLESGSYIIDGAVGTSGEQWNISSTSLTAGDLVSLVSGFIRQPAS